MSQVKFFLGHVTADDLSRQCSFTPVIFVERLNLQRGFGCDGDSADCLSVLKNRTLNRSFPVRDVVLFTTIFGQGPFPCGITHEETVGDLVIAPSNRVVNAVLELDANQFLVFRRDGIRARDAK